MSVSQYFRHINAPNEQRLMDALTRETIYQRGIDLVYIPRIEAESGFDYLFGENPENIYSNGVELEFWCENVSSGFDGADAIGRFALELGDTATFLCSTTRFVEELKTKYPTIVRPREGDLIVFKVDSSEPISIFEITFTEKELPFYQIGKSNVFRMEAERMNYSHETMDTGIPEIDDIDLAVENEYEDNTPIQTESDTFVNFDESDPFSDGDY